MPVGKLAVENRPISNKARDTSFIENEVYRIFKFQFSFRSKSSNVLSRGALVHTIFPKAKNYVVCGELAMGSNFRFSFGKQSIFPNGKNIFSNSYLSS